MIKAQHPKKTKPKVLVAMSGGVDSSVAAALLQEKGYDVLGGYMKNFSPESWQGVISQDCPWEKEMEDVEKVCQALGIEWRCFNFENEYQAKVVEYFFKEYERGRTPNPDVMCNSEIKFGIFLQKALELGFDYMATGHYARKKAIRTKNGQLRYQLLAGKDKEKDQSYFLWKLNQYQLSKSLFPIGEYKKTQVRELARKFGLPNSEKKDSQGICFVGQIKLKDFLSQRLPKQRGRILMKSGEFLGWHDGIHFYTIGQRQGIGLAQGPYYVAAKDVKTNTLFVAKDQSEIAAKECTVDSIHWISEKEPKLPLSFNVKIRYPSDSVPATLSLPKASGYKLVFSDPQFAVAPGQSIVFYLPSASPEIEVLGGGIIT